MAKKATLNVRVTPEPREADFLRVPATPLSLDDRIALRNMFASSAFKRAWHNALACQPSCLPPGDLNGPQGGTIANNRIHQQQGWEMFKAALVRQCDDPIVKAGPAEESYPDSGAVVGEIAKKPVLPAYPKPPVK